jgi:hypothetical protein
MSSPNPTPSKGTGRGGPREGAGRPKGSINKHSRALIAQVGHEGLTMPVPFLLSVMRDPTLPARQRMAAAIAVCPYLHPRLTLMRIAADGPPSEETLLAQVAQFEIITAAMPEPDQAARAEGQVDEAIEQVGRLSRGEQEAFYRRLPETAEARLVRLNAQPVGDRTNGRRPPEPGEPEPAPVATPTPSQAPQPAAEPSGGQVLHYDPVTRKLKAM